MQAAGGDCFVSLFCGSCAVESKVQGFSRKILNDRHEYLIAMLSFGECPSVENASHLSQILEASPHPKYSLSAKACLGIVRRAERRGKELPPLLKTALLNQAGQHSASRETALTEPTPQDATAKDGQRA